MSTNTPEVTDPRVRRTRHLLQQALAKLLESKEFSKISVQEVADLATLNRATFYDHYPDKFALLECMVGARFHELLSHRGIAFNGQCASALRAVILTLCDFLTATTRSECQRRGTMEPHWETAVIAVLRGLILKGLEQHPTGSAISPEMTATTASWAIYGAAREWISMPARCSSEEIASMVMTLVGPILTPVSLQAEAPGAD